MNREYIIWTPPYCGSAGVRALYKLADSLRMHGQSVKLWSWGETRQAGFDYADSITPAMQEEDIVVYPEIVSGNPLQIRNVVRWILFYPGVLGGEKTYHPSEKLFTWCDRYYQGVPRLFADVIDRTLFHDAGLPRTQDCTFVYKGGKWRDVPELDGLTEITMQWPKTREELVHLLQTTGTLYSWDGNSSLLDEAYYCGASVKIITEDGFRDFIPDLVFSLETFEQELSFFIQETQAMKYEGEMQPLSPNEKSKLRKLMWKVSLWKILQKVCPIRLVSRKIAHYNEKIRKWGNPA